MGFTRIYNVYFLWSSQYTFFFSSHLLTSIYFYQSDPPSNAKVEVESPLQNGSKPKTKLSKILSGVSNPDDDKTPDDPIPKNKSNLTQDASSTLSNVKLGPTTMESLDQAKRPDNPRSFHSESTKIAPTAAPRKQELEDVRDIEKDVQNEVASFKQRISSNLAIEKSKIEAELRAAYHDEIQQIRENLQTERQRQEENLKDVFAFEMQKLRETLESNLEIQRNEMMRNFNAEMDRDSRKMDGERQSQYKAKEEELRQSVENQLEHYRSKLKDEVEQQRVLIEKEFKERLLHDMEKARQEVIAEIQAREAKELQKQSPFVAKADDPILTSDPKVEFVNEIKNLEDEIRELKLQIKQQKQLPIEERGEINDSSDDGIEDVPKKRHRKDHKGN